jgi:hypothetical protein
VGTILALMREGKTWKILEIEDELASALRVTYPVGRAMIETHGNEFIGKGCLTAGDRSKLHMVRALLLMETNQPRSRNRVTETKSRKALAA